MKKLLTAFLVIVSTVAPSWAVGLSLIVTDKNNEPIIGAAVIEQGTQPLNGTVTDVDGRFTLTNIQSDNSVIEISSLGYKTQTYSLSKIPGTIVLEEEIIMLDDVVVEANHENGDNCNAHNINNDIFATDNSTAGKWQKSLLGKEWKCIVEKCTDGFIVDKQLNKCVVDCSKYKDQFNATIMQHKKSVFPTSTTITSLYVNYCYPTKCNEPLWTKVGNGENAKCISTVGTECKAKNAKTAFYDERHICVVAECISSDYKKTDDETACVAIEKNCDDAAKNIDENATHGLLQDGKCVISECANGFEVQPDKLSCAPKMVLSPEQYQDEIAELADNAQKMHERETSLENRILGAAGIGATGIGGTMIGGALAERRADDDAERAMRAYLETFRCDYGNGTNVKGGETNVELPGGNDMIGLYTEYAQLANDLKIRKEALGLRPGIESEVVIDKAETGLYEYSNNGITGGTYASIARALLNPDGEDAKMWAAQRAATDSKLKTGAIVAGVGAVGSLVGNIAINHGKGNNAKEIIARYEKLRAPLAVAAEHANTPYTPGDNSLDCSGFTGTTGVGKSPNCVCTDQINTRFNYDRGGCVPCESNKVYNQNDECVCPSATPRWNDATNKCEPEPTVCLLENKLKLDTKCECVENASAPDGKNCQCNADEGFEEKDGQCVQKEVPPEHESGSEIGKFSFSADALFASSRWEIKSDKLAQLRNDLANAKQTATTEEIDLTADDYCVVVVGKTDRTQYPKNSSMNNTKLSLNRANAIKNELKTVFKESNILTYGIAAKDCPTSKYPKANTADCRRVDVTWLAGSCENNKNNTTNWISNVAEATDAISELQSLLKK